MKRKIRSIGVLLLCLGMACAGFSNVSANEEIGLSDHSEKLYDSTYESLRSRITDRGYAATSLTGTYEGMFIRDSSIQVMAHNRYGDYHLSRRILDYLLRYHVALGADAAVHIIPDLDDELYGNSFAEIKEDVPEQDVYYDLQTYAADALFGLNRETQNGGGISFIPGDQTIESIAVYTNSTGNDTLYASLRTDIEDPQSELASAEVSVTQNGWQKIVFDEPVDVEAGATYYLFVQSDHGIAMFGSVSKPSDHAVMGYNYDVAVLGGFAESAYPAFRVNDAQEEIVPFMAHEDSGTALFKVNAETNNCAFGFRPGVSEISRFMVYLTGSGEVQYTLTTQPGNPEAAIMSGSGTVTENGWQEFDLEKPVSVTPGETYYMELETTSGEVIAYGSACPGGGVPSYNYDSGNWFSTPYSVAFRMYADTTLKDKMYSSKLSISGDVIRSVQVQVHSDIAQGTLKGELRDALNGRVLASAETAITEGMQDAVLDFGQEISVEPNQTYYVVLSASDNDTVYWNYDPGSTGASHQYENGEWTSCPYRFTCKIEPEYSGAYRVPIFTLGADAYGIQEIPSLNEQITAVDVILGNMNGAPGQAEATLYKVQDGEETIVDTQSIDISDLSAAGELVHLKFRLPLVSIDPSASYYLKIEAPDRADGSLIWYGTQETDRYETMNADGSVGGEASFIAYRSRIRQLSDHRQIDGNYMLIHAWCQFALEAPHTAENQAFIKDTYPIIHKFASYYLDQGYIDAELKLMRNDSFEHSREGRYWNSYDLITNVFASQALHELSEIALDMQDDASAQKWADASQTLNEGIHENLTTEVDGTKIYAELYDIDHEMNLVKGMSWVNLAPMAAEWYAMDDQLMQNTLYIYMQYGSQDYDGYQMLDVVYDFNTGGFGNHVIGKGLAWEIMWNRHVGNTERLDTLVQFILDHSTENGVYPETYQLGGSFSDVGNQEHASWQFYGMSTAFPQLTKTWHLDQLKDKVEELQDMDLGAYTDDSVTQLKDALSKAEALIQREDSTKAQLKEAYGQLDEAERGLVLKSDKRALAELIKKAEQLSEQEYTAASWTVLQDALRQAKAVMDDADADQAQIDEAAAALQEAIDQLQKVKDPVYTGTDHAKLIYGLLSVGMLALSGSMMLKKKQKESKA